MQAKLTDRLLATGQRNPSEIDTETAGQRSNNQYCVRWIMRETLMSRGREDSARQRSGELITIDIDETSRVSEHHEQCINSTDKVGPGHCSYQFTEVSSCFSHE